MWWGTNPASLEDQGWFYCDGRTINTVLFGSVTLPDLRNTYVKGSNTDYSGTQNPSQTDVNQWNIHHEGARHKHRFHANINSLSNDGGHSNTNSSNNAHRFNNNGSHNITIRYPHSNLISYGTSEHGYGSDRQVNALHRNNRTTTNAKTSNDGEHEHRLFLSWTDTHQLIDDGAHEHAFSGWDTETRPDTQTLHPIMFLGPRE